MSQLVFTQVIRRLTTVYGPPQAPDAEAYFAEYAKALSGYSAAVLESGMDRVIKDHAYPTWPTVGEIVKTCRAVAEESKPRVIDKPPIYTKGAVPPVAAAALLQGAMKSLDANNAFVNIKARCPIGGKIDVSKPWGEEVCDARGNIVPIRKRMGDAA